MMSEAGQGGHECLELIFAFLMKKERKYILLFWYECTCQTHTHNYLALLIGPDMWQVSVLPFISYLTEELPSAVF